MSRHIKVLLIDALNLIRRVYAAQPGEDGPDRVQSSVSACSLSARRALHQCSPSHAVCIFEDHGVSWRYHTYANYKAGRKPMPQALQASLDLHKKAFLDIGLVSLSFENMEADDVIAVMADKIAAKQGNAVILSTDKTFMQLLTDRIIVRDHFQQSDLDRDYVMKKFGVWPEQFVDFMALCGDSTNNIRGVPGIGPKTAAKLLKDFETLDRVLASAETIPGKIGKALVEYANNARESQLLVCLQTGIELGINLKSLRYTNKG